MHMIPEHPAFLTFKIWIVKACHHATLTTTWSIPQLCAQVVALVHRIIKQKHSVFIANALLWVPHVNFFFSYGTIQVPNAPLLMMMMFMNMKHQTLKQLKWAAKSSDLNPTEHLWDKLQR